MERFFLAKWGRANKFDDTWILNGLDENIAFN